MAQWYKALVLIVLVVSTSLYFIIYNLSIEFKLKPSERTMYNEKETLFPYTNLSLIEKVVKSNKSHDDVANQDFAVKENVEMMEKSCTPTKKLIFPKPTKLEAPLFRRLSSDLVKRIALCLFFQNQNIMSSTLGLISRLRWLTCIHRKTLLSRLSLLITFY